MKREAFDEFWVARVCAEFPRSFGFFTTVWGRQNLLCFCLPRTPSLEMVVSPEMLFKLERLFRKDRFYIEVVVETSGGLLTSITAQNIPDPEPSKAPGRTGAKKSRTRRSNRRRNRGISP